MLNYGAKWGEKYAQAVDPAEAFRWMLYAKIAAAYEISKRLPNLTFGHHTMAAYIEEPKRSELLLQAEVKKNWSVRELRYAITGINLDSPPPALLPGKYRVLYVGA